MASEQNINLKLVWPETMVGERDLTIGLAPPTLAPNSRSVGEKLVSPSLTIFGLYVSLMVTISSVLRAADLVSSKREALTAVFRYLSVGGLFVGFEVLVVLAMLLGCRIRPEIPILILMAVVLYLLGGLIHYNLNLV